MKRMLIDDTQPEETRVVIVDGNKIEDVEFETSSKKQIKGNIFTAKVIRIEPSLQAAFVDYGGNRHGFLAFGEIHPDYYNVSDEKRQAIEKEVDEIIERKRAYQLERQAERERRRLEREQKRAEYEAKKKALEEAEEASAQSEEVNLENQVEQTDIVETSSECTTQEEAFNNTTVEVYNEVALNTTQEQSENKEVNTDTTTNNQEVEIVETSETSDTPQSFDEETCEENSEETSDENSMETLPEDTSDEEKTNRHRRRGNRFLGRRKSKYKVSADASGLKEECVSEEVEEDCEDNDDYENSSYNNNQCYDNDNDCDNDEECDADDTEHYLEIQRKLITARKLYHQSTIQEVIKEGQTLLIQIVKEERGNKGAACTTYLSLAGRYCVLMPNRIKSGGVSRKITSATDRKRLKDLIKELPLNDDMSLIIRTAGEDKKREDIIRDYNYLIRTWNHIRHSSLSYPVPTLIYEEGNLIKRALRDMYTKDISEVIIDGDNAYKTAKDFSKILSPNMGRKIKSRKPGDIPVFQQYQVEKELDKLHNPVVQLSSGGYLVINPTEALVSIDVNSGRATHEMDIEETALKTNLEAADEIAKQLRLRNLAGLIVIDFIDMDEPANNHAVEKRMKEAMKSDRSRVQIAKMSIFGLLEISRQRMHSSFMESNYTTCPYCNGHGVQRTTESSSMLVLRALEEEGIKAVNNHFEVRAPQDTAIYLLNHKRRHIADLEQKYNIEIVISADNSIKNINDFKIEKSRTTNKKADIAPATSAYAHASEQAGNYEEDEEYIEENDENIEDCNCEIDTKRSNNRHNRRRHERRKFNKKSRNNKEKNNNDEQKQTPNTVSEKAPTTTEQPKEEKKTWWKKLIG